MSLVISHRLDPFRSLQFKKKQNKTLLLKSRKLFSPMIIVR